METVEGRGQPIKVQNGYSLVDLSPGILRNMCCGAAYWFCSHARKLLHEQVRDESLIEAEKLAQIHHSKVLSRRRAEDYLKKAAKLRDTAATAVSHLDTVHVVRRANEKSNVFEGVG